MVGAKLAKVTGQDITHVPFRGGAPSLQAVLAGDVQILVGTPPVALPQIRSGTLKALSLSTRLPSPVIPDVQGSEAAGLPALPGPDFRFPHIGQPHCEWHTGASEGTRLGLDAR